MSIKKYLFVILAVILGINWYYGYALSGWSYFRYVSINNTATVNLADYQIKIIFDTATPIAEGKMNSDCSDIRFTEDDGITLLSYWINESTCNTANTVIWVKVPSIPASSTYKIRLWYGNPTATSESNGSATFIFYEDFSTGAAYDSIDTYCSWNATEEYLYCSTDVATSGHYGGYKNILESGLCVNMSWKGLGGTVPGGEIRLYSGADYYRGILVSGNGDGPYIVKVISATATTLYSDTTTRNRFINYDGEFCVYNATLRLCTDVYGCVSVTDSDLTSFDKIANLHIDGSGAADAVSRIDNVFVRKYVDPEPTTTIGSEIFAGPPVITIEDVENKTYLTSYFNITYYAVDEDIEEYACGFPSNGLVANWHFDEELGDNFADSSGYSNNGVYYGETFNNGTTYGNPVWVDGKYGKALSFDGVDDYVEVPDSASLNFNLNVSNFTLTAWIKISAIGTNHIVYKYSSATDSLYDLYVDSTNKLNFLIKNGTGTAQVVLSTSSLKQGEWYFVVGVATSTELRLYVNGKLNNTASVTYGIGDTSGYPLWIGRGAAVYSSGTIDEVRIYNRALSNTEIQQIYENNTFIRDGLVAYWRFDEGSGTTVYDTHHIVTNDNKDGTKYNNALSFDGIDDYVKVPDSTELNPTTQVTATVWFYANDNTTKKVILYKGVQARFAQFSYRLLAWNTGLLGTITIGGTEYGVSTSYTPNEWHFVSLVYDNTSLKLYMDGVLASSLAISGNIDVFTGYPLIIGYDTVASSFGFNGTIDEVRIYNRALTDTEIQELYQAGLHRLCMKAWLDDVLIYENTTYINGTILTYNTSLLAKGLHNFSVFADDGYASSYREVLFTVDDYDVINYSFTKYQYEDESYDYEVSLMINKYIFNKANIYFIYNNTLREWQLNEGEFYEFSSGCVALEGQDCYGFYVSDGYQIKEESGVLKFYGDKDGLSLLYDYTVEKPVSALSVSFYYYVPSGYSFNVKIYNGSSEIYAESLSGSGIFSYVSGGLFDKVVFDGYCEICGSEATYIDNFTTKGVVTYKSNIHTNLITSNATNVGFEWRYDNGSVNETLVTNTTTLMWRSWLNDVVTYDGRSNYWEGENVKTITYLFVVLSNYDETATECLYSYEIKNSTLYTYLNGKQTLTSNKLINYTLAKSGSCDRFYTTTEQFTSSDVKMEYFNDSISRTKQYYSEYYVINNNRGNISNTFTLWHYDIELCDATYTKNFITNVLRKEEDFTLDTGDIRSEMVLYDSFGKDVESDYFYSTSVQKQQICLYNYPTELTYSLLVTGGIFYKNSEMTSERSYYLNNVSYIGNEITIDLFTINTTATDNFLVTFNVKDEFGSNLENAQIKILKLNETTNTYYTLMVVSTDVNGNAYAYLEVEKFYKFIISYQGVVYYISSPIQLYQNQYSFIIKISSGGVNPVIVLEGVAYDCNVTNNEQTLNCYVSDNTNKVTASRLIVWKRGDLIKTLVYDNWVSSSTAYYNYTISENKTHEYKFYIYIDGYGWFLAKEGVFNKYVRDVFSGKYLFESLFLILVVTLLGVRNPQLALIMNMVGFVIAYLLGFTAFSYSFLVAVLLIGLISLWRMRK